VQMGCVPGPRRDLSGQAAASD